MLIVGSLYFTDSNLFALEKVKDPAYLQTVFQFDDERNTIRAVLIHTYVGYREERDEPYHEGFVAWKNDVDYLISNVFLEKSLFPESLEECKSDFQFWVGVSHNIFFEYDWPREDGIMAITCLEEMQRFYNQKLDNNSYNSDFIRSILSELSMLYENKKNDIFGYNE